eukprot:COSAG04_NODE_18944_length_428_cov_1.416413_1_plen_55_part_10
MAAALAELDHQGYRPLERAAECSKLGVQLLIAAGADATAKTSGCTALHCAAVNGP